MHPLLTLTTPVSPLLDTTEPPTCHRYDAALQHIQDIGLSDCPVYVHPIMISEHPGAKRRMLAQRSIPT